jgi:hypothetical protein
MKRVKALVVAGLFCWAATPVLAQEMGGAIGPGSNRGLEPTYSSGYYGSYGANAFWSGEAGPWGNTSYASMGPEESYCAERYRSFDPASGTYLGYDGRRHLCR